MLFPFEKLHEKNFFLDHRKQSNTFVVHSPALKHLHFILSLVFVSSFSNAQLLKGIIVDGETQKPLVGVVVSNMNSGQITLCDSFGRFSLVAQFNNIIMFSFQGYKTQTMKVPVPQVGVAMKRIEMFKLSYQLDEFIYRPKYTRYQMDSIERTGVYQRVLSRTKSTIGNPVSWLVEKFNPNCKRIFRFQKNYQYWERQMFLESRYIPEIVEKLTNLHGDTLATFMNTYPLPYDYARVASELEIKIFIRDSYKQWLQHPVYPFIISKDWMNH